MLFSLLLVTVLPVVGFLLYILFRPVSTKFQRNLLTQLAAQQKEIAVLRKELHPKVTPKKTAKKC